jgi:hypothetical protein
MSQKKAVLFDRTFILRDSRTKSTVDVVTVVGMIVMDHGAAAEFSWTDNCWRIIFRIILRPFVSLSFLSCRICFMSGHHCWCCPRSMVVVVVGCANHNAYYYIILEPYEKQIMTDGRVLSPDMDSTKIISNPTHTNVKSPECSRDPNL